MIIKQEYEILFYEIVKTSFNKKELNKEIQKIKETDQQLEFLKTALYLLETIPPTYSFYYWLAVCRYYEINKKMYGVDPNVNYKNLEPLINRHYKSHPGFDGIYVFDDPRIDEIDEAITGFKKQCKDIMKSLEEKKVNTKTQQSEFETVDLSDSKPSEKIALLYELGIIDYLHKKDGKPHTVNSIATVLSGITGIKAKTIQSAINPFINTHSTSKGKPADSTLLKAKNKIVDLGF